MTIPTNNINKLDCFPAIHQRHCQITSASFRKKEDGAIEDRPQRYGPLDWNDGCTITYGFYKATKLLPSKKG